MKRETIAVITDLLFSPLMHILYANFAFMFSIRSHNEIVPYTFCPASLSFADVSDVMATDGGC